MKYRRNGRTLLIRRLVAAAGMLVAAVTLAGCEQFFTTSPFSFLQRDPSNLSPEQQISYARLSLESGDTETQRNAYEAIKDSDDPEVQLLASKVAVAASGLNDAMAEAAEALLEGESYEYNDFIANVDVTMLENSVTAFGNADGNTTISDEEYLTAAAASAIVLVEDGTATDLTDALTNFNNVGEPGYYLTESGYTEDEITSLVS